MKYHFQYHQLLRGYYFFPRTQNTFWQKILSSGRTSILLQAPVVSINRLSLNLIEAVHKNTGDKRDDKTGNVGIT
jgi:hypothetical protein